MHDWTLLSVLFDWKASRVTLSFIAPRAQMVSIVASDVSELHMPQENEWGASVSVNRASGLVPAVGGRHILEIEMQSGDCIKVSASAFEFPPGAVIHNVA